MENVEAIDMGVAIRIDTSPELHANRIGPANVGPILFIVALEYVLLIRITCKGTAALCNHW